MSLTTHRLEDLLQTAYRMELESVVNYLANSEYLDGTDSMEIRRALAEDVLEELNHARLLAKRIKQIGGRLRGSTELTFDQQGLTPPEDPLDIDPIIQGVVEAERAAIRQYQKIIEETSEEDPVTADLATRILAEEEAHRVLFEGFLAGRKAEVEA